MFPVDRTSVVQHSYIFSWKGKWPHMQLHADIWPMDSGLSGESGNREGAWWENWWERHMRKKCGDSTLQMWEGGEDAVSHANAHHKVTSADEEFSNQADKVTCGQSTSLSSHPCYCQWACDQSGRSGRDGGCAGTQHMGFHSPRLTWQQLMLSARSTSNKDQHWAPYTALFPGMTSQ